MDLEIKHPDWESTKALRKQGRDYYAGEQNIKAGKTEYLKQGKNELALDYDRRLELAVLDPYVEKVVHSRQAVLFAKEHKRELSAGLEPFKWNVDLAGTPADPFFAEAALQAQIAGAHWVLVDAPRAPESPYASRKAEVEAGHRPFFQHIPAENVFCWGLGRDNHLDWLVQIFDAEKIEAAPGIKPEFIRRYKVWTRKGWIIYEPGGDVSGYKEIEKGTHPIGEVPLVPFVGERISNQMGLPIAHRVFQYVKSIYNKQSDRDYFEHIRAYPQPYTISAEPPVKNDTNKGFWVKALAGVPQEVGFLEITGAGSAEIRETVHDYERKIYAVALSQALRDSAQVQSADGQREDRRIFTSGLRDASREYESAEQRCWDMLAKWVGSNEKAEIFYDREFDDKAIDAQLLTALGELVDREVLTRKTLLETVQRTGLVSIEDVQKELDAATQERADATAKIAALTKLQLAPATGADENGGRAA